MRYQVFSNQEYSPLSIDYMGVSGDMNITAFGPARRSQYIVHYVTKGKGIYNGKDVRVGQGFLIFPGELEEYRSDTKEPWEFLWVVSSDPAMEKIFQRYQADPQTGIFVYDNIPAVETVAKKIRDRRNEILDSNRLLEWYLSIFNRQTKEVGKDSAAENYLDFTLKYMESNIHRTVTVKELTDLLGVSQPYLYKIFKEATGVSPKQYMADQKINYAKHLLKETDMTVTQIANSVGYGDLFSFSKFFAVKTGVSPQKYRQ